MKELIQHLEAAVLSRNPSQTERLQFGLPVERIRKELKRAGVVGKIDPIVGLYSWRNGTNLQGFGSEAVKTGFVPPIEVQLSENIKQLLLLQGIKRETDFKTYNFIELEMALLHQNGYKKSTKYLERYFPILWDGSTNWIAVDIDPSGCNKVVTIQKRDNPPLREAYATFEEFLKDVIRANESNEALTCLRTPGKPIAEEPESHSTSTMKVVTPRAGISKKIPSTENPLVLRTDFSDEAAWESLCKALQDPDKGLTSSLDFVSDRAFDGLAAAELPSLVSESLSHTFAFIVDHAALTHSANPVLVIDLHDKPGRTFRVTASALGEVTNNLSIANMDFDEFAKAADKKGVFRGFSRT